MTSAHSKLKPATPHSCGDRPDANALWTAPQVAGWLAVNLGYAGALAGLSLMSSPPVVPVFSTTDWLAHGVAFGLQTVILSGLLRRWYRPGMAIAASATVALLFGFVLEGLQHLQPARQVELSDLVANATGVCLGAAILVLTGGVSRRAAGELNR